MDIYQGIGYYYHTGYDKHNGFYVATTTGGLGTPIYMGHFDVHGNLTIPTPVDITGTAGGRGNSQWKVLCDNDTNAYIIWASYTNNDISISKIKPNGTLPWANAKQICAAAGQQDVPDVLMKGDTIYAIWDDGRPGAIGYDIYMQKIDTAGNMLWSTDGILLSNVASYIPYPKMAVSGANIISTYLVGGKLRAQQLRPDSSSVWYQPGVAVNVPDNPFYGDYQLVSAADGAVTIIWRSVNDDICAARIRRNGTLTNITSIQQNNSFAIFPNPATDNVNIQCNHKNVLISIYNNSGALVYQTKNMSESYGRIIFSTYSYPAI